MKVSIIGARKNHTGIGEYIAKYFHKNGVQVVSLLGTNTKSAQKAALNLKQFKINAIPFTDFAKMVKETSPNAIVIASPYHTHYEYLRKSIDSGLSVFCEKPFIWDLPAGDISGKAETLINQARRKRLTLAMNSQLPFTIALYEKLSGKIIPKETHRFLMNMNPSMKGESMIPESLPHPLSILYYTLGKGEISQISFDTIAKSSISVSFKYKTSATECLAIVNLKTKETQPRDLSFGFNGRMIKRTIEPKSYTIYYKYNNKRIKITDPLETSIKDFIRSFRNKSEAAIGYGHILNNMQLLKKIYDAYKEHKTPKSVIARNGIPRLSLRVPILSGRSNLIPIAIGTEQAPQSQFLGLPRSPVKAGSLAMTDKPRIMKNKEHDFAAKLKQESTVKSLKGYINWRKYPDKNKMPSGTGPISINLDLTSACNFACPFCVDSGIINSGKMLSFDTIKKTIDRLKSKGLLSVILLGGGEPTLHRDFEAIVRYIKGKGMQLGIVTNGTRLDKVIKTSGLLKKKDWVRLSIDAANENTFKSSHNPRISVTLKEILAKAKELKRANPLISLGYSFVIVWEGAGKELTPNINEMAEATKLARENLFDYISFKPCLVRLKGTQRESLLHKVNKIKEDRLRIRLRNSLEKARKAAGNRLKVLESVNLTAILDNETDALKQQPAKCHQQFFRTVVTPSGVFHCPAFRGVKKARIAPADGYSTEAAFKRTMKTLGHSIEAFNAESECREVGCFYHKVNWWIEDFINSSRNADEIVALQNDNFFL
ncbi:MAG: radical SAM protein [Planctomycetes bacterium]|nr:radical SAM protein [Planctomycetota bacterium]